MGLLYGARGRVHQPVVRQEQGHEVLATGKSANGQIGKEPGRPFACYSRFVIESLSAVTLTVSEMRRSVEFYEALGFEIKYGGPDADFTSFFAGSSFLNLDLSPSFAGSSGWGRAIFYVTDVDETYRRAIEAGLKPEFQPH